MTCSKKNLVLFNCSHTFVYTCIFIHLPFNHCLVLWELPLNFWRIQISDILLMTGWIFCLMCMNRNVTNGQDVNVDWETSQWKAITVKSRYPDKLVLFSLKVIDTNVNVFTSFFSPILWSLKQRTLYQFLENAFTLQCYRKVWEIITKNKPIEKRAIHINIVLPTRY